MTEEKKELFVKAVDLHCKDNNTKHHTAEISEDRLIVRRGQAFNLTLTLTQPFVPNLHPLSVVAITGKHPAEDLGTKSVFGIPDTVERSPSAKAVWTMELDMSSSTFHPTGVLHLVVAPPADAPIGQYNLTVTFKEEEEELGSLVVLFNPWCADDWVFLPDEEQRQEYVMNEQGIIYKGTGKYIVSQRWDFGQFEDSMVEICMMILDLNHKHQKDPADDVSARCNPIYVSRVVSAMINSDDDRGVLQGRWTPPFWGGVAPSHWSGSHAILKQWQKYDCYPVKYGQCWVFAGVMCSVMRLLGIPCRVVTNYQSAHDNNRNLIIDVHHADYGVRVRPSRDSVWNYHVWVEAWMRRPDLAHAKYDGWQVVDPTPQEKSDGVYCCGPAPVRAILDGETDLKYDVPFVYAEVNADCIDWLFKADGSRMKIWSDTKKVGQSISTKSVGSTKRETLTDTYKHREGSVMERSVFEYACSRDFQKNDTNKNGENNHEENGDTEEEVENQEETEKETDKEKEKDGEGSLDKETPDIIPPLPPVSLQFEEVSTPINGKDVSLKLVLRSTSSVPRPLSINICVYAMTYNGSAATNIQSEVKEETLQPGTDLSIPILVPLSAYHQHMVDCDSMKVSAIVTDRENPDSSYLAESNIVLGAPPISVTVSGTVRLYQEASGEVVFTNPVNETLTSCTLTLSGSGLFRDEVECKIPDMRPNTRIRASFFFVPYKLGEKTLMVDFDCATFRDIKANCSVYVRL